MAGSTLDNVVSLAVQRQLATSQARLQQSAAQLASGLRLTSAGDDAAGLAVSDQLGATVRALTQASRNVSDGVSLLQTADAGLANVNDALGRMAELATQAASGLVSDQQRQAIDAEFQTLRQEIDRTAATTSFNGTQLLDGSLASTGVSVQAGADGSPASQISVTIASATSSDLGGNAPLSSASLATATGAQAALGSIDTAAATVASARAVIGAGEQRLQSGLDGVTARIEGLTAAQSQIRDVDVAKATAEHVRNQILTQAGVSVLAQANQQPRRLLQLIE